MYEDLPLSLHLHLVKTFSLYSIVMQNNFVYRVTSPFLNDTYFVWYGNRPVIFPWMNYIHFFYSFFVAFNLGSCVIFLIIIENNLPNNWKFIISEIMAGYRVLRFTQGEMRLICTFFVVCFAIILWISVLLTHIIPAKKHLYIACIFPSITIPHWIWFLRMHSTPIHK